MAFYLFEPAGIPYKTLIDRLVDVALRRYKEKFETNFAFDSEILKKIGGAKTGIK
jgi:D-alanine-D-alanine ligase